MFQNLIEANGKPKWKDDVPERLQQMASRAFSEISRGIPYEDSEALARWSNEFLNRAVKKDTDWFAERIQHGEIADNEYTRRMCDPSRLSPMELTSSLDNYLGETSIRERALVEMQISLCDDNCVVAKLLAGRAILLFDSAATQWHQGNRDEFIDALYNAEHASSACIFYSSWKMGECYAEPNYSALASKGARARNAKYQPLKDRMVELVNARKFKSRRNAAKTVTPEILNYARTLGVVLSADQAEITITRWLEEKGLPANV